jgi:hypothetical protein
MRDGLEGKGALQRLTLESEGGFDGIYFCGFFPKLRFFAYFLHISLILPGRSCRAAMGLEGARSAPFRAEKEVAHRRQKTNQLHYFLGCRERALPQAMPRKTSWSISFSGTLKYVFVFYFSYF